MKSVFADYLAIYNRYPRLDFLTKEQRRERYSLLCAYEQTEYSEEVSIEEFQGFMAKHRADIHLSLGFIKHITPILKKDIRKGGVVALKFLTENTSDYPHCYECIYTKFHSFLYNKLDELKELPDLLDLLIQRERDYLPALNLKIKVKERAVDFYLHELPWCVLLSKEEAQAELKELDEYEGLIESLGKAHEERKSSLERSRFYLKAWSDYLDNRDSYESFEHYLNIKGSYQGEY